MIQAVMVISTQAKPRLLKFYNFQVPNHLPHSLRPPYPLSPFPHASTDCSVDFPAQIEHRCIHGFLHARRVKLTNQFCHSLIYVPLCFVVAATREASGPRSQRFPMYVRFTSPFGPQFWIDDVLEMCRPLLQCCQQGPTT
jgi:hypothetical protein